MFQETNNDGKTDWKIRQNETNEELHVLPKHLSNDDMFKIIEFARKFELIAFNKGINFQKEKQTVLLENMRKEFDYKIKIAREENARLATKLMQYIGSEDN